jgi:hypothetical protein
MANRLPTGRPSSFGYFYSPALAADLARETRNGSYDLVFAHSSSAAPYVEDAETQAKVLDFADIDSEKWAMYASQRALPLSAGYWLESVKLRREERRLAARFDLCTCTTVPELDSLKALGTARQADWFPNGVDTDFFHPAGETYDPDLISFSGRMDYFPNQKAVAWFCAKVFPQVRRWRPRARFAIVGANPSAAVRRLGTQPGVLVTGTVPDVRPYVQRAAVSVAPLEVARGVQNKILEAMAMGVPVICSPLAARGVDAIPGEHILTASQPDEFAEVVLELLANRERRASLAARARERALSHYTWEKALERMDGLIDRCLAGRGSDK